jgi:two-component system response regulator NreC
MPGITGTKVAKMLLEKHHKLCILALTMHDDEHYVRDLFSVGVRGYLLKRSTGNELTQAIRALYRGESYLDPALVDLVISPYVGRAPAMQKQGRLGLLTAREQEVCGLLAHGYSHKKAAEKLHISPRTVETHRTHIMKKLGFSTRADLIHFAIENGLLKAL